MYRLTLTSTERSAFDWVGNRYAAGEVASLLLRCQQEPADVDWDAPQDITFIVPEHIAWAINDLADDEDHAWPCFAPELVSKLEAFCAAIV